jgi:hypothetical protein
MISNEISVVMMKHNQENVEFVKKYFDHHMHGGNSKEESIHWLLKLTDHFEGDRVVQAK